MKTTLVLALLLTSFHFFGQNDQKSVFQKSKYELAVSYYKKADLVKAIDLFSLAAKIKPDSEIGQESLKKVDTLRRVLRKEILDLALGTWKKAGNQPIWASTPEDSDNTSGIEEVIEIKEDEILFFEVDKKSKARKLIKTENLIYNDANSAVSPFSEIILSDGKIWNCSINEKSDVLHVINVTIKTEDGIEKIKNDNEESYYIKI